jgi:hypothetical protein
VQDLGLAERRREGRSCMRAGPCAPVDLTRSRNWIGQIDALADKDRRCCDARGELGRDGQLDGSVPSTAL